MRDGTVLQEPVSFENLYRRFGDSWRIPPDQSLLCKERKIETGNPMKPFYANDLTPRQYERARGICVKAGDKEGRLLDDCTLDVTVLGNPQAAKVFVHTAAPVAVMRPGSRSYR
jgi:hypothetical protein